MVGREKAGETPSAVRQFELGGWVSPFRAPGQPIRGNILLTDTSVCSIYRGMIKLRLNELLEERGQTPYWLWKQTGLRWATIWQMGKGGTMRVTLDTLDRVCAALECQPGDLLVRVENRKARKRGK